MQKLDDEVDFRTRPVCTNEQRPTTTMRLSQYSSVIFIMYSFINKKQGSMYSVCLSVSPSRSKHKKRKRKKREEGVSMDTS
jgi:hypothetical protein